MEPAKAVRDTPADLQLEDAIRDPKAIYKVQHIETYSESIPDRQSPRLAPQPNLVEVIVLPDCKKATTSLMGTTSVCGSNLSSRRSHAVPQVILPRSETELEIVRER